MLDDTIARRAGERELAKRLEAGEAAKEAVWRGWITYHNRLGGQESYDSWTSRYMAHATRKEAQVKKSVAKALKAAIPSAPSVPRIPAVRPTSLAGTGTTAVLDPFEEEVAEAEKALAKAHKAEDPYAVAAAQHKLREARYRRTALKMVVAENAREADPALVMRSLRGQGVPLLSNRHALRDDPSLRGI